MRQSYHDFILIYIYLGSFVLCFKSNKRNEAKLSWFCFVVGRKNQIERKCNFFLSIYNSISNFREDFVILIQEVFKALFVYKSFPLKTQNLISQKRMTHFFPDISHKKSNECWVISMLSYDLGLTAKFDPFYARKLYSTHDWKVVGSNLVHAKWKWCQSHARINVYIQFLFIQ
jgi:hypothetical protein